MKKSFAAIATVLVSWSAGAQVKLGTTPGTINANSVLELEAANKGLLLPRITLTAVNNAAPLAAATIPTGIIVYNTGANFRKGFYFWDGAKWNQLVDSSSLATVAGNSGIGGSGGSGVYTNYSSGSGVVMSVSTSGNQAAGSFALSSGYQTNASGAYSTATGQSTTASGINSFACGLSTTASGAYSFAGGQGTQATGINSFAVGYNTIAGTGGYSFAAGQGTHATGQASSSFGLNTVASGLNSFAIGNQTTASGQNAFSQGDNSQASGDNAIAMGHLALAASNSIALGDNAKANTTDHAVAIGNSTTASATNAVAIGDGSTASASEAMALGYQAVANANNSIAIGRAANTGGKGGSMALADGNGTVYSPAQNNHLSAIFEYGYQLKGYNGRTFYINNDNSFPGIRPADDNQQDLGGSGFRWRNIFAGNNIIQTSDGRFKKNVAELGYGLSTIMKLRPVSYNWKDAANPDRKIGFIAQEVKEVVPEVVHTGNDAQQSLGINYSELTSVLVKAMQEQQAQIEELKKENAEIRTLLKRK